MQKNNVVEFDFGFGDAVTIKSAEAQGKVFAVFASADGEKKYMVEFKNQAGDDARQYFLASDLEAVKAAEAPKKAQTTEKQDDKTPAPAPEGDKPKDAGTDTAAPGADVAAAGGSVQ